MIKKLSKMVLVLLTVVMMLGVCSVGVLAEDNSSARDVLNGAIGNGYAGVDQSADISGNTYSKEGGGTLTYSDCVEANTGLVNSNFEQLTEKGKRQLLDDMLGIADKQIENDRSSTSASQVTNETKTSWLNELQSCNGVGTQLMTSLLQNTKPDYATANRIYEPFSGIVGTVLGLGSILIMAFLGITMVLDLTYMCIPAFRMMLSGDGATGDGKGNGSKPKIISYEAVSAVQLAEGGSGTSGQQGGTNKLAVGIYFKKRVIMLIVLGVCLLYLIQGQIFALVSMILDLVSGFLGF